MDAILAMYTTSDKRRAYAELGSTTVLTFFFSFFVVVVVCTLTFVEQHFQNASIATKNTAMMAGWVCKSCTWPNDDSRRSYCKMCRMNRPTKKHGHIISLSSSSSSSSSPSSSQQPPSAEIEHDRNMATAVDVGTTPRLRREDLISTPSLEMVTVYFIHLQVHSRHKIGCTLQILFVET